MFASFSVILFLVCVNQAFCFWYSSTDHMGILLKLEKKYLSLTDSYIQTHKEHLLPDTLLQLQRLTKKSREVSNSTNSDSTKYLANPINLLKTIQRFTGQWQQVVRLITQENSTTDFSPIFPNLKDLPTDVDEAETFASILRIQRTYILHTNDLVHGSIKGNKATEGLNGEDAFKLGKRAHADLYLQQCVKWFSKAFVLHRPEHTYTKSQVLKYLSLCEAKRGNVHKAKKLLQANEHHSGNLNLLKQFVKFRKDAIVSRTRLRNYDLEMLEYQRLCRVGKMENIQNKTTRNLKCYLHNGWNNPRLLLRPVKVEELLRSPHVVRFYDVISDSEIMEIKKLAKARLKRSEVYNPDVTNQDSKERVGKNAWLDDFLSPVVEKFSERISDVTGLSLKRAEPLQVANYGIGGQFEPHLDEIKAHQVDIQVRIATFLTYFNDIELGGSTPFVYQGIVAEPIKGSAIFWYNLLRDGSIDERTEHAGCPVVLGNKWVANKWISSTEQVSSIKCNFKRKAMDHCIL